MNAIFYKVSNSTRAISPSMRKNCFVSFCQCHVAYGIWISWPGIDPRWPGWKSQVLTTGLPENFPKLLFYDHKLSTCWTYLPISSAFSSFMPRAWGILEGGFRCPPAARVTLGEPRSPSPRFLLVGSLCICFLVSWLLSKDFWRAHCRWGHGESIGYLENHPRALLQTHTLLMHVLKLYL